MRMTFARFLKGSLGALIVGSMLTVSGCDKLGSALPKHVCGCSAMWWDSTCPTGSTNPPDAATWLISCPDGLEPKKGQSLTPIPPSDVDFDEMADATVAQIVARTGMNLRKSTSSTKGQYYGDVGIVNGQPRAQWAQVFGCAVANTEDLLKGWKYKQGGVKPHSGHPWDDAGAGGAGGSGGEGGALPPPPTPPGPPPDPSEIDPCSQVAIDDASQTVTVPSGCSLPSDVNSSLEGLTNCTEPASCPAVTGDSKCLACAKANCCNDVSACLNDTACLNAASCVLQSGGQASCVSAADTNAFLLQTCLSNACAGCAQPTMQNCGGSGDPCGTGYPPCCNPGCFAGPGSATVGMCM